MSTQAQATAPVVNASAQAIATEAKRKADELKAMRETAREEEMKRDEARLAKAEKHRIATENSPLFRVQGAKVNVYLTEKAIHRADCDAGKIAKTCKDKGIATVVAAGDARKIANIDEKAFKVAGDRGLLGTKQETAARLESAKHLRNLVGALIHFGLMERQDALEEA